MQTISPQSGLRWIQLGWQLFASQPSLLLALFFGNMLVVLLLNLIPVIGGFLATILAPATSMATLSACAFIARKQALPPGLLFIGYRSPTLPNLLRLGLVYASAIVTITFAMHFASEGQLMEIITGKIKLKPGDPLPTAAMQGMLTALILYPCVTLLFWFTAPLVMWQEMKASKALFFSFFAVWRARGAFLVYGLSWLAILLLPFIVISVLGKILGSPGFAAFLAMGLVTIIKVCFDCSCFASFQQVFGDPKPSPESAISP